MSNYEILVIVGSLRKESINLKLGLALKKLFPSDFKLNFFNSSNLPLYNQDLESHFPAPAMELKEQIKRAQGLLFVTPEHNRSIPAALKNVIDWGSRPWGQNSWQNKGSGIVGTSPSAAGTGMAQQHLRNILAAEGCAVLPAPEVFLQWSEDLVDETHTITNEKTRDFLQIWVNRYVQWITQLNK